MIAGRMTMTNLSKRIINAFIRRFRYGFRSDIPESRCEGFDTYLEAANKAGEDVNDWIETVLQWKPALPVLKEVVFPYLENNSTLCEIGSGTGRQTRHIIPEIPHGTLHLFDHSLWIQKFLKGYFSKYRNVHVHNCDGLALDMPDHSTDLVFSNGTFIEMKLGTIFLFSNQFARIVKHNGFVIFDYIDISTREGWQYLESQSAQFSNCYTYHSGSTIDKIFSNAGFELIKRYQYGKSTYVVYRKM